MSSAAVTVEMTVVLAERAMEGLSARDRRGKEGITLDDMRDGLATICWTATTKPSGLLADRWSNGWRP